MKKGLAEFGVQAISIIVFVLMIIAFIFILNLTKESKNKSFSASLTGMYEPHYSMVAENFLDRIVYHKDYKNLEEMIVAYYYEIYFGGKPSLYDDFDKELDLYLAMMSEMGYFVKLDIEFVTFEDNKLYGSIHKQYPLGGYYVESSWDYFNDYSQLIQIPTKYENIQVSISIKSSTCIKKMESACETRLCFWSESFELIPGGYCHSCGIKFNCDTVNDLDLPLETKKSICLAGVCRPICGWNLISQKCEATEYD